MSLQLGYLAVQEIHSSDIYLMNPTAYLKQSLGVPSNVKQVLILIPILSSSLFTSGRAGLVRTTGDNERTSIRLIRLEIPPKISLSRERSNSPELSIALISHEGLSKRGTTRTQGTQIL